MLVSINTYNCFFFVISIFLPLFYSLTLLVLAHWSLAKVYLWCAIHRFFSSYKIHVSLTMSSFSLICQEGKTYLFKLIMFCSCCLVIAFGILINTNRYIKIVLFNISQIIALSTIETKRNNTGIWLSTCKKYLTLREKERRKHKGLNQMKIKYGRRLKDVVSTNVKISEKGPSHDISNNIKHWQDLPAPRKILRERKGRERRPYSQQSQLSVTSFVLNQDAEEVLQTAW